MRFFFPLLSLLISGALLFLIVMPWYADVTQIRGDIAAYSTALDNSTYLQKTQDTLLNQFKNVNPDDKARLERFLPNTVDNIEFILQVEQLANLYNMPIKNIKFDNPKTDAATAPSSGSIIVAGPDANVPYGTFTLQFDTEGTYAEFTSFLKDLEHNLRLVDVKSIAFTVPTTPAATKGATTTGPNPNVYDYTLSVDTYWLK